MIATELTQRLKTRHQFETFVYYFLHRLVLINLAVDSTHVPMVFEVINDRGVRLKPYEILKGKLLGQIDKLELEHGGYNELWEERVRAANAYRDDEIDNFFRYWLKAWLTGRLVEKHPTRLILDVHGVGYDVAVPVSTFYAVGEPGVTVTLRVHTHVREDAIALFGFLSPFELLVFERLIATSGIGPKLALAVLSGIEAVDFVGAVQRGDVARLTRIPGVGKKTAERICLELKDKLPPAAAAGVPESIASAPHALRDDLVSALANLGYHRSAVDKVLDKQLAADDSPRFEAALRAALKELARS